jgi:AraC-like DNA-binding protein
MQSLERNPGPHGPNSRSAQIERLTLLASSSSIQDGLLAYRAISFGTLTVDQHRHGTVALTVPLLGGLTSIYDGGQAWVSGPSAVLHPPDGMHGGVIGDVGLDAVEIEFDPAWLRRQGIPVDFDQSRHWTGGRTAAAALRLAKALNDRKASAEDREFAAAFFFQMASKSERTPQPSWLNYVSKALEEQPQPSVKQLAIRLNLNPDWLGQAYRASVGEGILETICRRRVERAASLLRSSDQSLTQVALETGFSDQSHMTRRFRAILGRTPAQVRRGLGPQPT